jgi:hypothetical protein
VEEVNTSETAVFARHRRSASQETAVFSWHMHEFYVLEVYLNFHEQIYLSCYSFHWLITETSSVTPTDEDRLRLGTACVKESKRMGLMRHVARMEPVRCEYNIWSEILKGRDRCRWQDKQNESLRNWIERCGLDCGARTRG